MFGWFLFAGHNVWHPCKDNTMWYGVGHNNSLGGGVRNAFGKDFEKYGFVSINNNFSFVKII